MVDPDRHLGRRGSVGRAAAVHHRQLRRMHARRLRRSARSPPPSHRLGRSSKSQRYDGDPAVRIERGPGVEADRRARRSTSRSGPAIATGGAFTATIASSTSKASASPVSSRTVSVTRCRPGSVEGLGHPHPVRLAAVREPPEPVDDAAVRIDRAASRRAPPPGRARRSRSGPASAIGAAFTVTMVASRATFERRAAVVADAQRHLVDCPAAHRHGAPPARSPSRRRRSSSRRR